MNVLLIKCLSVVSSDITEKLAYSNKLQYTIKKPINATSIFSLLPGIIQ